MEAEALLVDLRPQQRQGEALLVDLCPRLGGARNQELVR
jgi:hypothetical protein